MMKHYIIYENYIYIWTLYLYMKKMYDAYFTIFYFNLINKPIGLIFDDFINLIFNFKIELWDWPFDWSFIDRNLFVCSCSILSNIRRITPINFWNWSKLSEESIDSGSKVGRALFAKIYLQRFLTFRMKIKNFINYCLFTLFDSNSLSHCLKALHHKN